MRSRAVNGCRGIRDCARALRLALLLLLALPGVAVGQAKPTVTVCRPIQRDAAHYDFPARFEPGDRVEVRASLKGRVLKLSVQQGAKVRQGDVILELDSKPLESQRTRAERQVQDQEEELRRLGDIIGRATKLTKATNKKELIQNYQNRL